MAEGGWRPGDGRGRGARSNQRGRRDSTSRSRVDRARAGADVGSVRTGCRAVVLAVPCREQGGLQAGTALARQSGRRHADAVLGERASGRPPVERRAVAAASPPSRSGSDAHRVLREEASSAQRSTEVERREPGGIQEFDAADETHRLWIEQVGDTLVAVVASDPMTVPQRLRLWKKSADSMAASGSKRTSSTGSRSRGRSLWPSSRPHRSRIPSNGLARHTKRQPSSRRC